MQRKIKKFYQAFTKKPANFLAGFLHKCPARAVKAGISNLRFKSATLCLILSASD